MEGVTTAIVAFIFYCIVYPQRVKSRPQFFAALTAVCLMILLAAFGHATIGHGISVVLFVAVAALQVGTILILFMAVGGLSWDELKDDMARSYEVIRRGGEEKEVIVPLSGEMARRPVTAPKAATPRSSDEPGVIRIDDPAPPSSLDSGIPLE